ncbi:hypothetical protein P43SY_003463 [Pythium insidiosum]|uniref:Uncharacterized protein n=1 Tax=Pythium insidiosum TaxID=114742 RepID=A0AAD5LNH1_PYTIN|nr:hypothetical protein P43SY_003463 [Pythium insidiosum]
MAEQRHVSRWRAREAHADTGTGTNAGAGSAARAAAPCTQSRSPGVSLRYLDEFVRKLQCAPRLLEHQLFPEAKEITESMGLFNAVRRYVLREQHAPADAAGLSDGVIVVGDGNTPRTAAMFAFRLRQWKCYSVDPAMEVQSTERSRAWEAIENLVVIRNKIENVRLRVRRAIVVLVHAHVTIEQALSAVDAASVLGVVTMPCCNWYGEQETLRGRQPDLVYDDYSVLSDHRELRVWIDPLRKRGAQEATEDSLAIDQSAEMMKGCVRKFFVGESKRDDSTVESVERVATAKRSIDALAALHDALAADSEGAAPTEAAVQTVAQQLLRLLPLHTRVLVLRSKWRQVIELLAARRDLTLWELCSRDAATPGALTLSVRAVHGKESHSNEASIEMKALPDREAVEVVRRGADHPIDCIVDLECLFRAFRSQPKKHSATLLRRLVLAMLSCRNPDAEPRDAPVFVSLTPRKDWRKPEYLAHDALGLTVTTTALSLSAKPALFLHSCHVRREDAASATSSSTTEEVKRLQKEHVLRLKAMVEARFQTEFATHSGVAQCSLAEAKSMDVEAKRLVLVRGIVQHLRRFSQGPSFLSLAPAGRTGTATAQFRDHLQVALESSSLAWSADELGDVVRVVRKGDEISVLGRLSRNDQGHAIVRASALRFHQSEFQAYE